MKTFNKNIPTNLRQLASFEDRAARTSYYSTLDECLEAVQDYIDKKHLDLVNPNWRAEFLTRGELEPEQELLRNFGLNRAHYVPTDKWLHVVIYRMPTGRYEVNCYLQ